MDNKIISEISKKKTNKRFLKILDGVISVSFCVIILLVFLFSLTVKLNEDVFVDVPTIRVVKTDSMAKKNVNNKYLFTNELDDQLQVFDLILTYKKPAEEDLKLYDIVVYQQDDYLIVHRIVGIEEPNESHPNERHFLLQGDAISSPDKYPVLYSQIKGIYNGEKIVFWGSFVLFMQSPVGWLCIILTLFTTILSPLVDKRMKREYESRFNVIRLHMDDSSSYSNEEDTDVTVHTGG